MKDIEGLASAVNETASGYRDLDARLAEFLGDAAAWEWFACGNSARSGEEVWVYWSAEGGGWWMWGPKGWRRRFPTKEAAEKSVSYKVFDHPPDGSAAIVREAAQTCPAYTTSLDAALAFVTSALPGAQAHMSNVGYASVVLVDGPLRGERFEAANKTEARPAPALALLSAAFGALVALNRNSA